MKRAFLLLWLFNLASINFISSKNLDYIYPKFGPSYNNYSTLGLIHLPNARMHPGGSLAFSWSHLDPYIRGSIIAYPFDWLEAAYHYTDINNALYSDIEQFSGKQSYKDKGFDFKVRLLAEQAFVPQIAIGIRDLAGTGTFEAEFLTFSKIIKNIDLTFGIGWGDLAKKKYKNPLSSVNDRFLTRTIDNDTQGGEISPQRYFSGPVDYFGGVEIFLPNLKGLRFKVEYDTTNYETEAFSAGASSFKYAFEPIEKPTSRINYGFVYPVTKNFQLKASMIKGNQFTFGFSYHGNWGSKSLAQKKEDLYEPVSKQAVLKKVNAIDKKYLYRAALKNLNERSLYLQHANIENNTLSIVYAQSKHGSYIRAAGRVASVLDDISPEYIENFEIININADMAMHAIELKRESFSRHRINKVYQIPKRDISIKSLKLNKNDYEYNPVTKYPKIFGRIEPNLRSQIGGPDGFYFGDLRVRWASEIQFNKSFNIISELSYGITNNFDDLKLESDSVIPHVRTDIVKYLKATQHFSINRLQANIFNNLTPNIYTKFSFGLLETMFAGYGGEILYRPFYSNFAIGAEAWHVYKRDFDMRFDLNPDGYEVKTGHINLYYTEPRSKVTIALKGGKFLAQDSGINFDFSRRFETGLRIGAFFSLTDISEYEFGEGSFDKGFYFNVPIEIFSRSHTKQTQSFGLKPLTRDGAAFLIHSHNLWGVTDQAQHYNLDRDWDDLYE
ncbi:YjbH domain-containing protein [Gammaproteobacteria bacterium]|nr:YjbH domain-containing protein [Gammaproteobacteria bacterium]